MPAKSKRSAKASEREADKRTRCDNVNAMEVDDGVCAYEHGHRHCPALSRLLRLITLHSPRIDPCPRGSHNIDACLAKPSPPRILHPTLQVEKREELGVLLESLPSKSICYESTSYTYRIV